MAPWGLSRDKGVVITELKKEKCVIPAVAGGVALATQIPGFQFCSIPCKGVQLEGNNRDDLSKCS